eukprot:CAMPEP_0178991166 /NCGR_PEP_ID=MMETSP0795-20121207/5368_1 /TAXON_ID=88552 /ORGANISM="Amoebophrya sp., Strain Ameob2" /LENGTH=985 /DNA_ID=CAMNT_0020682827 /DNA_START=28 /DNA_END=2985 /DNA_ORIENTATION=-
MSNSRPPTADNPKLRAKQELLSQLLNESVDLCLPGRVTCKNAFAVSLLERIAKVLASDETLRMSSDLQAGAYILEAANKLFSQRVDGVSSLVLRVLDELSKAKGEGEQLSNGSADASSKNENHLASEPASSNSEHLLDTANASIVSHADLEQNHASKFEFLRGYLDNQSFDKHLLVNVKTNTECALLLQGGDLAVQAKDSDNVSALTATTAATSTSAAKKRNEYHVRYDMPVSELLKLMESRKSGGGTTSASASATSSCDRDVGVTEGKDFLSVEKALRAAGAKASTNTNKRPSMEDSEDSSEDSNSACAANAAAGELHSVLKRLSKQGARFKSMYFENQQAAVSGSEGTATGVKEKEASEQLYTYFGSAEPKSAPPRPVKRFTSSTENAENRQENFPKSSFRQAFEENEQLTEHRTRRVLGFSEEEMEEYEKQWTVGEKTAGEGATAAPGDRLEPVFAVWGGDASPRFTKEEVLAREMDAELEDGYQYQVESEFADLELGTGGLLDAKILDLDAGSSSHATKRAAARTENIKSVSTGVPLSSTGVPLSSTGCWEKKEQMQKLRAGEASFSSPVGAMGALDFEDEFLFPEMRCSKKEKFENENAAPPVPEDGVFYEHVEAPVRELPLPLAPLKMKAKKKTMKTAASGGPAAKKQRKGVVVRMLDDGDESASSSSIRISSSTAEKEKPKGKEILAIAPDLLGRAYSELLDVLLEPVVSPPSSPCWHNKEKMAVGSDCGGVAGARSDLGDAEEAEGMLAEMTAAGEGDIDVVSSGVVGGRAKKVAEELLPFTGVEPMEVDGTNSGKTVFQDGEKLFPGDEKKSSSSAAEQVSLNRADQLGVEFDLSRSAGGPMEEVGVPMEEVGVPMEEVSVPMEEVAVPMEEVRDLLAEVMDALFEEAAASRGMESRGEESELPTIEFKQVLARIQDTEVAHQVTTAMCFLGLLTVANMSGALTLNQESAENFQIVKDVPGKLVQMLANHGLACEN